MIDLDTAMADELDTVPQLSGHEYEIARYREECGRFDEVRQLEEVSGVDSKWDGTQTQVGIA